MNLISAGCFLLTASSAPEELTVRVQKRPKPLAEHSAHLVLLGITAFKVLYTEGFILPNPVSPCPSAQGGSDARHKSEIIISCAL